MYIFLTFLLSLMPIASADTATVDSAIGAIPPYQFAQLVDGPIPQNLVAKLKNVAQDMPKPYIDRCHTQQNLAQNIAPCTYADLKSKTTIVLFGDSHALSWFPAIEKLAIAKQWKLVSLSMSSCWPADIPAWNSTKNERMDNCEIWRTSALKRIASIKPAMVFVAGTKGFSTLEENGEVSVGQSRVQIWRDGMTRTIKTIKKSTPHVIILSDTPAAIDNPAQCMQSHVQSLMKCSHPTAEAISVTWLTEERNIAAQTGSIWINPTEWICNTDPCSLISGNYLIYRDAGHLTASFSKTLEAPLWQALSSQLNA